MALTTAIFDLGGVLVWTDWERATGPFAAMSSLTPEQVMEEIVSGHAAEPFMLGAIDPTEFHRRLAQRLGLNIEANRFFDIWRSVIQPNEGIAGLVEGLRGRYRLAVGSNTDVLHYKRSLEVQPALRHFDEALLSYELARCKPDVDFFRLGLDRLSATPEECFFIDDREDNVEAADSLGITAIQFVSREQLELELSGRGLL